MDKKLLPIIRQDSNNSAKTFVFDSKDRYIQNILLHHGWICVPKSCQNYQLKWTWLPKIKDFSQLKKTQFINHFKDNHELTTKIGLMKTLTKNQRSQIGKSSSFYPRTYDLSQDFESFELDYQETCVMNLLKKFMIYFQIKQPKLLKLMRKTRKKISHSYYFLESLIKNNKIFSSSVRFMQGNKQQNSLIFDQRIFIHLLLYLQQKTSLEQSYLNDRIDKQSLIKYSFHDPPYNQQLQEQKVLSGIPSQETLYLLLHYYSICKRRLKWFKTDGIHNIWIVKANQSSRGRNIFLVDKIDDIKQLSNGMRVVQKYVQNIWVLHYLPKSWGQQYPFLKKILNKKFDLRFWVLVKSFNPLIFYIYDQAYLRVSKSLYQLNQLKNQLGHLTNFSTNFSNSVKKNLDILQSYVLFSQFQKFIQKQLKKFGLKEKIQEIIKQTLNSVDFRSEGNQFQLYGFDIIIDGDFKPWILQCNLSPACSQRGQIKKILHQMGQGLLNIMGFIQSENFGWKLIQRKRSQDRIATIVLPKNSLSSTIITSKKLPNSKSLKSIKTIRSIQGKIINLPIIGCKINWKAYQRQQKMHFILQKVLIIQRFYRKKFVPKRIVPNKLLQKFASNKVSLQIFAS